MAASNTPVIKQYFSRATYTRYVLKNGNTCHFVSHRYRTADPAVQEEIESEIKAMQHDGPYTLFYIRDNEYIVDSLIEDPLAGLKKKLTAELETDIEKRVRAKIAAENASKNSEQAKLDEATGGAATAINPAALGKVGIASSVTVAGKAGK